MTHSLLLTLCLAGGVAADDDDYLWDKLNTDPRLLRLMLEVESEVLQEELAETREMRARLEAERTALRQSNPLGYAGPDTINKIVSELATKIADVEVELVAQRATQQAVLDRLKQQQDAAPQVDAARSQLLQRIVNLYRQRLDVLKQRVSVGQAVPEEQQAAEIELLEAEMRLQEQTMAANGGQQAVLQARLEQINLDIVASQRTREQLAEQLAEYSAKLSLTSKLETLAQEAEVLAEHERDLRRRMQRSKLRYRILTGIFERGQEDAPKEK